MFYFNRSKITEKLIITMGNIADDKVHVVGMSESNPKFGKFYDFLSMENKVFVSTQFSDAYKAETEKALHAIYPGDDYGKILAHALSKIVDDQEKFKQLFGEMDNQDFTMHAQQLAKRNFAILQDIGDHKALHLANNMFDGNWGEEEIKAWSLGLMTYVPGMDMSYTYGLIKESDAQICPLILEGYYRLDHNLFVEQNA